MLPLPSTYFENASTAIAMYSLPSSDFLKGPAKSLENKTFLKIML